MAVDINPKSLPEGFSIRALPGAAGVLDLQLFRRNQWGNDIYFSAVTIAAQEVTKDDVISAAVDTLVTTATRILADDETVAQEMGQTDKARALAWEVAEELNKSQR